MKYQMTLTIDDAPWRERAKDREDLTELADFLPEVAKSLGRIAALMGFTVDEIRLVGRFDQRVATPPPKDA